MSPPFTLKTPAWLSRHGVLGMNRRNVAYIGRYNQRRNYPLVDDKLKTKLLAHQAGLNTPALLHVVSAQHEIEVIEQVLMGLREFVVKPAQGSGGKGILVVTDRSEDGYVKTTGERISIHHVKRHLSNVISGLHSLGGRNDVAIVETLVHAHPLFSDVSVQGVPDIRLIVFQGYPVMGMLRLATHASDGKANLHQGAIGVGLDIGTGRAISAVQFNQAITRHPDTGAGFSDLAIPNWHQLLVLAARAYDATNLGYLGCDIVLDPRRGPLLLELNARPGLTIQVANQQGLLPRLRFVESLDRVADDPEERVALAMRAFSQLNIRDQAELPFAAH